MADPAPHNDNAPAPTPARLVPIIGEVRDDGRVRFTDPPWRDAATRPRPAQRPRPHLRAIDP